MVREGNDHLKQHPLHRDLVEERQWNATGSLAALVKIKKLPEPALIVLAGIVGVALKTVRA